MRRLLRILLGLGLLLLLGLAVLWWFLPEIACAAVRPRLPIAAGALRIERVDPSPPPRPEARLEIPAGRLRAEAMSHAGRWIPPGVLRSGLSAGGALTVPKWRALSCQAVVVGGGAGDALRLLVRPAALNEWLEVCGRSPLKVGAMAGTLGWRVDGGTVEPLGEPDRAARRRAWRVEAHGAALVQAGVLSLTVPIRRLAGIVTLDCPPAPRGWHPVFALAIDELDAPGLKIPMVGDLRPVVRAVLSVELEGLLNDSLDGKDAPEALPWDLPLRAVVE